MYCKHNYHPRRAQGNKWWLNDPFACDLLAICLRFGTRMPLKFALRILYSVFLAQLYLKRLNLDCFMKTGPDLLSDQYFHLTMRTNDHSEHFHVI